MRMIRRENIRIGLVTWFFPKISETFVMNQVLYLKNSGYAVTIYCIKDARRDVPKEDFQVEDDVHEVVLNNKLLKGVVRTALRGLRSRLIRDVKKGRIDLLFFQFPDLASIVLKDFPKMVPVATVVHDLPVFDNDKKNLLKNKLRNAFIGSDAILPISDFTKDAIIALGCPTEKITVYPMGADEFLFVPKFVNNEPQLRKLEINLTIVARFVPKKGIDIAIRSIYLLQRRIKDRMVRLRIIGDGVLRPQLLKLVKDLRLEKNIEFAGKLTQQKVVRCLEKTDILICSSLTDENGKREGLPVVLIEGSLMGIPIVATNHAAIPELSRVNDSIVLVKEGSAEELASAVKMICTDYRKFRKMAVNKRDSVAAVYGTKNLKKQIVAIVDQLLKNYEIQKKIADLSKEFITKIGRTNLACIALVGSLARQEKMSRFSDVDIIVVFNTSNMLSNRNYYCSAEFVKKIGEEIGLPVAPQIYCKYDFIRLVSPVLMHEYKKDAKVMFGKKFLASVKDVDRKKFELSILKRMLFQRYIFRQKVSKETPGPGALYDMSKTAKFFVKYFVWLKLRRYETSLEGIISSWRSTHIHLEPYEGWINDLYGTNNISSGRQPVKLDASDIIAFVESVCDRSINEIRMRYGGAKIDTF